MQHHSSEYQRHLKFLYDLEFFGIKLGLEKIRLLCSFLGDPQHRYPIIHIAGTNGKGSVAAMIASVLTASGYKTGLYTSPHLVDFNERIRIDGVPISEDRIVRYTELLKPEIERTRSTFFEATTAMAFRYFADEHIDVAVIETGLGGRFDATNVVIPVLSIITSIGSDHTEHLGSTLEEIAYQKGGIIKRGVTCVTGFDDKPAIGVIQKIGREQHSQIVVSPREVKFDNIQIDFNGIVADINSCTGSYDRLNISVAGNYQLGNVQTALRSTEYLISTGLFPRITKKSLYKGFRTIRELTGLRGRLEILSGSPFIIADVAHNPPAVEKLSSAINELCSGKILLIFGLMRDKDLSFMGQPLVNMSRMVISVEPETQRALPNVDIIKKFHELRHKAIIGGTVREGIVMARNEVRQGEIMLITGSHYVVGEAINYFKNTRANI